MSSASEAEIGALFVNCKVSVEMSIALQEMGHSQQPVPIMTDNSTAEGFANDTIKQRKSEPLI